MEENTNLAKHSQICAELFDIYKRKNHDYGDSFHKTYSEFGRVAIAIRLQDKVSRLTSLTCKDRQLVKDETIRDTLLDLANYSILGIMELDAENGKFENEENTPL